MKGIRHLSFYRFCRMGEGPALAELRAELRKLCGEWSLKGTILLAPEGVNAMVSGTPEALALFRGFARERFPLEEKDFKEGPANEAFRRMLVKVKKEIISVGNSEIRPHERTAPRVSAAELKRWLDEKRPLLLLDARNRYEVEVGTFRGAEDLGLDCSRDFAAKAAARSDDWRNRTVVTFCTGGIRCEKASAVLQDLGLADVYQLDGGILRYFEENGGAHFEGSCFVFDWRLAVSGELRPVPRSDDAEREFGRHRKNKSIL